MGQQDELIAARSTASRGNTSSADRPDLTDRSNEEQIGEVAPRVTEAMQFLLQAKQYADDVGMDVWTFALELRELRSLGLTNSDLRWLTLKGFVKLAHETTLPGESGRTFHPLPGINFTKRTCVVITALGIEALSELATHRPESAPQRTEVALRIDPPEIRRVIPHWDSDLQELRVNGLIVKQFKVPAPNQEMVLAAFDEEAWPARIDDPLPPVADQDPKRRLHDTIVSLNRNHKHRLIRFMGDGSGEGVRWTMITDDAVDE